MTALTELLRQHPEIVLFAALSLGFFLGKRKVGNFSLGTSAGVLLTGVWSRPWATTCPMRSAIPC